MEVNNPLFVEEKGVFQETLEHPLFFYKQGIVHFQDCWRKGKKTQQDTTGSGIPSFRRLGVPTKTGNITGAETSKHRCFRPGNPQHRYGVRPACIGYILHQGPVDDGSVDLALTILSIFYRRSVVK